MSSTNNLPVLTRFFSASVIRQLATKGKSPLLARLAKQSSLEQLLGEDAVIADLFDTAFDKLKISGNRDEYVYRSALVHKILLGKHSLNTASILNEVRAGACKADVVILNGTSTVYEIKSERDSLARLENQIRSYRKVFASTNVIMSESHYKSVRDLVPEDVGLMVLTDRFQISVRREAIDSPSRTCPAVMFETLRTSEAIMILQALGVHVPEVPNIHLRSMLSELICGFEADTVHHLMVKVLKKTRGQRNLNSYVKMVPKSLQAGILTSSPSEAARQRISEAIKTPLSVAMSWG
ncbi:sce7726 family protein [Arthrobacter sp. TWP1-1]|uniref:sce7726 family protein n=1 Tax=Arthrobacter sp. TWP1-1 TaxID=2804568 RepID=UPI003CEA01BA